MAPTIQEYQIKVPDADLERLQRKLELTTFPKSTTFTNDRNYGVSLKDIKRLVSHWRSRYDWRRAEAELNKLPQFTTAIPVDGHEDNLKVHFIYQKSDTPHSIPLLFVHGWASSCFEVRKILPLLTRSDENAPTFHVVAPSLPNCGFSQSTSKPGFGILQHAEVCHKLMLQLGYDKYVTQGGDWGFLITRAIGMEYPNHVLASHLNFILTLPPSPFSTPLLVLQYLAGRLSASEKEGLKRTQQFAETGSGYANIHKTRPHTLGFSLADSPAGLLAWMYEKLRDWSDEYPWTDDEILTWGSIYLFSDAGPDATIRLYYEIVNSTASGPSDAKMGVFMKYNKAVHLGLSYFPKDVIVMPSSWGRTLGPVAFEKRHTEGGHFAAYEKPELLVADVRGLVQNLDIHKAV